MPLYAYTCRECSKYYEVIVPLKKEKEKIKCPHCDKTLKKEITPVYFRVH
jgi:putative FmdB family regulatory protein